MSDVISFSITLRQITKTEMFFKNQNPWKKSDSLGSRLLKFMPAFLINNRWINSNDGGVFYKPELNDSFVKFVSKILDYFQQA